jgi:hypothetical protein
MIEHIEMREVNAIRDHIDRCETPTGKTVIFLTFSIIWEFAPERLTLFGSKTYITIS